LESAGASIVLCAAEVIVSHCIPQAGSNRQP
jgi:hypothetical protein